MPVWSKIGTVRGAEVAVRLATTADGTFALPLPAGLFKAPPVVTATVEAQGGRDHVATLTATAVDLVQGRVRRSRGLPSPVATLTALAGYDPFESPGIVTVHLAIRASSS